MFSAHSILMACVLIITIQSTTLKAALLENENGPEHSSMAITSLSGNVTEHTTIATNTDSGNATAEETSSESTPPQTSSTQKQTETQNKASLIGTFYIPYFFSMFALMQRLAY